MWEKCGVCAIQLVDFMAIRRADSAETRQETNGRQKAFALFLNFSQFTDCFPFSVWFPSVFQPFLSSFFSRKKNFSSSYISLLPSTQTSMTKELQQPKITCAHLNHFHRINPPPSFPHNFSWCWIKASRASIQTSNSAQVNPTSALPQTQNIQTSTTIKHHNRLSLQSQVCHHQFPVAGSINS